MSAEDAQADWVSTKTVRDTIVALTTQRGEDASICPSEVARALAPGPVWQKLMGAVRVAATDLAQEGRIEILRKGKPVDPRNFKGVFRLRIAAAKPADPA